METPNVIRTKNNGFVFVDSIQAVVPAHNIPGTYYVFIGPGEDGCFAVAPEEVARVFPSQMNTVEKNAECNQKDNRPKRRERRANSGRFYHH